MKPANILQSLQSNNLLKTIRVSEVMQSTVIHASPTASVLSIAKIMAAENIASVVIAQERVVGKNAEVFPLGIIVERDIVRLQALERDLAKVEAKTVMSGSFFSVRVTNSLFNAFKEMERRNLQQLVVIGDAGELVGIVTRNNCLQVSIGSICVKKTT